MNQRCHWLVVLLLLFYISTNLSLLRISKRLSRTQYRPLKLRLGTLRKMVLFIVGRSLAPQATWIPPWDKKHKKFYRILQSGLSTCTICGTIQLTMKTMSFFSTSKITVVTESSIPSTLISNLASRTSGFGICTIRFRTLSS